VVFFTYDPVTEGLVTSIARPDRNTTGLAGTVSPEIVAKHLELLSEAVPGLSYVGYVRDPTSVPDFLERTTLALRSAAAAKRVRVSIWELSSTDVIDEVFSRMKHDRLSALILPPTAFAVTYRRALIDAANRHKIPVMYGDELFVREGGLMAYWTSIADAQKKLGQIVGALLNGKKPADIPIEQPTRFKLTVNLNTARIVGVRFTDALLSRADEIVK
jgi:putative ABC transport system substrate-binding protein